MKILLSQSYQSLVFCEDADEDAKEIWKICMDEGVSADRLIKEYNIAKDFSAGGRLRKALSISEYRSKPALVLEHIPGETLEEICSKERLSVAECLDIAIQCASFLVELNNINLIHNRINSRNLIYDREGKRLVLIDFAHAESAPYEPGDWFLVKSTIEDLGFYAPELINRLNKRIDLRSDYFSIGVVLYQLLTGQLPFYGKDASEVNYALVAHKPTPIRWLNPLVPKFLEDIVLKLLEKSPDERYQSANGLLYDLTYCLKHIQNPENLLLINLGQNDESSLLIIPERYYGRQQEHIFLKEKINNVASGDKALLNIVGASGTGKSTFGNLVLQEVIQNRGIFVTGKYDSYHAGIPHFALFEAFRQLATHILSEEENRLEWWKSRIQSAVGNIGKLLIDLIPEYQWIIGEQPEVSKLEGIEGQSRITYLFERLISHIAEQGQPLVVFLDDMHYGDPSSLALIHNLIASPLLRYFMVVCSYSDRDLIIEKGDTIHLHNLTKEDLGDLVKDTLKRENISDLIDVVYQKTQGNPFFMHQFIQSVFNSGMIYFDYKTHQWKYDLEGIKAFEATRNVIDLVISKIEKLAPDYEHVLKLISCLEDPFRIFPLIHLTGKSEEECVRMLAELSHQGLIQSEGNHMYRFAHDRIKQTIYEVITDDDKKQFHLNIATWLLNAYTINEAAVSLFELAKHLNQCYECMPPTMRSKYIEINYQAGLKSRETGAFSLASNYFGYAIDAVIDEDWEQSYDLILSLYIEGAKAASVNGYRDKAGSFADTALHNSRTSLDRVKSREIYLRILTESHQLSEAVDLLLIILKELGFPLQRKPSSFALIKELVLTKRMLLFKSKQDILNLPDMTNVNAAIFMRLTAESASSLFATAPEIFPLIIFKQVQLSLKYGNCSYSPNGYVAYGFALLSILGNTNKGYEFGEIALDLMNKFKAKETYAKVITIFYAFVSYWKKDIRDSIVPLKASYQTGRENGDLLYASFATIFHSSILFFSGEKLSKVLKLMEEDSLLIKSMNQQLVYTISETQRQMVKNLATVNSGSISIIGDDETEDTFVTKLISKNDKATLFDFYIYKLILAYFSGQDELAYEYSQKALNYEEETSSRQICYPYFMLFSVLSIAKYVKVSQKNTVSTKILRSVKSIVKKLEDMCKHAPSNFISKYYLASGSYYEIKGEESLAVEMYTKAIHAARDQNFIQEEAIAYELIAQCYIAKQEWSLAEVFIQKSWKCYDEWGAVNKTNQLMERFPEFIKNLSDASLRDNTSTDLSFVMNATRILSSELTVDGFLTKILQLMMGYSSVQKGAIVIKDFDESLKLKAMGDADGIQIFTKSLSSFDKGFLPVSVIHYVARTSQPFVLESVVNDPTFGNDPYFKESNIQSVCCFPIVKNSELISLIYLENKFSSATFDNSVVEFLTMLSPQIAISLENALLFESQERMRVLENDYNQNLLTVSHQAEENERKRIAEELHDDIGALLSTTKLYLSHMNASSDAGNVQVKVSEMLDKAIHNLRHLSHRLSPMSLDRFGLKSVLESLCNEIDNAGSIKVESEINIKDRLSFNHELQLYRISQELLNNAIKYSKASLICLKIDIIDHVLHYEYRDNGVGFDIHEVKSQKSTGRGIGIHNIANRVNLIKGKLSFNTAVGEGVRVAIEIANV